MSVKSKREIELDNKRLLISKKLDIPFSIYDTDKTAFIEMCEAFLKAGYEITAQYNDKRKTFAAVGIHHSDIYCPLTHAHSFMLSTMEAIYIRLRD